MIELAVIIVKPKQERGNVATLLHPSEAAYDAIRAPMLLHLQHGTFPATVRLVQPFRHDAVQSPAARRQPGSRISDIIAAR